MVIFFDIDGTIIDEDTQKIPESAARAIGILTEKGHIPIINTGRPYSHLDPRIRALPFAGWVCGCGMEVYLNNRWLQKIRLDEALSQQVIHAVRQYDMQVIYEVEGGFLLDGDQSVCPRITLESERMLKKGFAVRQTAEQDLPPIIKFVTFDGPSSRHAEFVSAMAPYLTCMERGKTMVEYVPLGCSKAQGLQMMLDALQVDKNDTFAFGDSTNDIAMFRAVGHPICMGNGMPEAQKEAEFVTDSVLNDGIEKALRHFGLID